jgi:hypothetical protein
VTAEWVWRLGIDSRVGIMKLIRAVTGNALVLATLVIVLAGGILATQASPGAASSARLPAAAVVPVPPPISNGESAAAAAAASELADDILPRSPGWMKVPRGSLIDSLH